MIKTKTLHERYNGKCYFCGCQTKLRNHPEKMKDHHATREHLIPKIDGGSDRVINIKLSCFWCNDKRGTMNAVKWFKLVNDPIALEAFKLSKRASKKAYLKRKREKKQLKIEKMMLKNYGLYWRIHTIPQKEFDELFGVAA